MIVYCSERQHTSKTQNICKYAVEEYVYQVVNNNTSCSTAFDELTVGFINMRHWLTMKNILILK